MKMKISKNDKKMVTIDVTNVYDKIKKMAEEDIRTFEEEVRYLIKRGIESNNSTINYVYNYKDTNVYPSDMNYCDNTTNNMKPINETVIDTHKTSDGTYVPNC